MNACRDEIADLVADIRFSERRLKSKFYPEEFQYMEHRRQQVGYLFSRRHSMKPNRYGELIIKGGE